MLTRDLFRSFPEPSLWRDMARLQDEMNRLVSRAGERQQTFPAVNLWTGEEGAVITAELPGVESGDLDISVVGDTVTLRGSRSGHQPGEGDTYHRRERGMGRFARTIQLPFRVEANEVEATMRDGVMTLTLPRAHADRPKKIEIKTTS